MDELTRLELDTLVERARLLRITYALGEVPEELPVALAGDRCGVMAKHLRKATDPTTGKTTSVGRVWASFEPDERGLLEVLFVSNDEPMTAWMRGTDLAYLVAGW